VALLVLPESLSRLCSLARELSVRGDTVRALLSDAAQRFPSLGRQLLDEQGGLRRHLTVFLNDEDVRPQGGLEAAVGDEDVVTILPPIAGGGIDGPGPLAFRSADACPDPIRDHAESAYPEEACGLVFEAAGGAQRVVRMRNVSPRAREAFEMAPAELLAELTKAAVNGERLALVYHSHADGTVALSPLDRLRALSAEGAPLWPDVGWLVVAVERGRVTGAQVHRF
jgi:proteasome lid subunit RPN8/RPN11/molybdopterin converting factor small subunit